MVSRPAERHRHFALRLRLENKMLEHPDKTHATFVPLNTTGSEIADFCGSRRAYPSWNPLKRNWGLRAGGQDRPIRSGIHCKEVGVFVPRHSGRASSMDGARFGPKVYDQKDPEVVFWPSGILEAWGTKAKKPHIFKNILVF